MKPVLGTTRRGHAVYSVHHDSYAQLERIRHLGSSPSELSHMARQAHPHYRAVDHEEAAQMHYAVGAFHAARAHEAASAAMAKSVVVRSAKAEKPKALNSNESKAVNAWQAGEAYTGKSGKRASVTHNHINLHLSGQMSPLVDKHTANSSAQAAKHLNSAIGKQATAEHRVLYRGASQSHEIKAGQVFASPRITAASESQKIARNAANSGEPGKKKYVYEIHAPAGSKALSVSAHSEGSKAASYGEEKEHIFGSQQQFKVHSVTVKNGIHHVVAHALLPHEHVANPSIHKAMHMTLSRQLLKAAPPLDQLTSVYAAVGPQMTPQDAADIGSLLMPEWTPAQHREAGLAQQALAQMFMGSDKAGHENQAMQAMAAAFVHLSAAGQLPGDCIAPLYDDAPTFNVADDTSVTDAGVTKSKGVLGTTKFGQTVHIGDPLPEHKDKATSALVAHGKHVAASHPHYSKQDHFEASFMHAKAAKEHGADTVQGRHHTAMANAHVFAAPLKKSTAPRKAPGMITLDESKLMKAAKYGSKPLGTTLSGKTVHGLRENMNAPIANGIIHAGKKADPGAMAYHIHKFNPTFTHGDHTDAAIAHKTEAATLRGKAMRGFNSSNPARQKASATQFAHAERHQALAMAHYHASKATGRGTGASRKGLTTMKSEAEMVLQEYLGKAIGGGKSLGHIGGKITGHEVFSSSHPNYSSGHFTPRSDRSELGKKQRATGAMKHVLAKFPKMSGADHAEAARMHQQNHAGGGKAALVAMAHEHAAAHLTKLGKSLSKADGEGSRGGKVVGHTKSGKPIYAGHSEHYAGANKGTSKQSNKENLAHGQRTFPDYSRQDHVDAADHHWNTVKKYSDEHGAKSIQDLPKHMAASVFATRVHNRVEEHMLKESEKGGSTKKSLSKAQKGEGSRGGKVVGHTKSGKPIYASHAQKTENSYIKPGAPLKLKRKKNHDWDAAMGNATKWNEHVAEDKKVDQENARRVIAAHPNMTAEQHRQRGSDLAYSRGRGSKADNELGAAHYAAYQMLSTKDDDAHKKSMTARKSEAWMDLFKAGGKGEGSRGGKVIGHTKSGKPIYSSSHDSYKKQTEASFGFGVEKPTTRSGKRIPGVGRYKDLDHTEHGMVGSSVDRKQWKDNGEKVLANHPKWSMQDHREAATHHAEMIEHGGGRGHGDVQTHKFARDAHHYAAAKLEQGNKAEKSFALDTLSLAKGFIVPPSTYFWGQPQHRVS